MKDPKQISEVRSQGKGVILLKEDITLLGPWSQNLDGIVATVGSDTSHFFFRLWRIDYLLYMVYLQPEI